ncbi:MAG TPA: hypothetical protein VLU24_02585 [Mycobacterium sp.]|nr:hypothetical protein [Mycobacterium sp.]
MADVDPHATQQDLVPCIAVELRDAGFDDVEEIGRGGYGVVYRRAQPLLDRAVAVSLARGATRRCASGQTTLYDACEFADATRLLDERYQRRPEGGGVDYLAARYVVGAKIKAARGTGTQRSIALPPE